MTTTTRGVKVSKWAVAALMLLWAVALIVPAALPH
jgi:hypothetical protein